MCDQQMTSEPPLKGLTTEKGPTTLCPTQSPHSKTAILLTSWARGIKWLLSTLGCSEAKGSVTVCAAGGMAAGGPGKQLLLFFWLPFLILSLLCY